MPLPQTQQTKPRKPLRLWPGVVVVALQWLVRFIGPKVVPEAGVFCVLAGLFGGVAAVLWWVFFSRAPWSERLGAVVLMIVGMFATSHLVHASISTGMMGMMLYIYAIPVLSLALVVWAVASRRLSDGVRRALLVGAILLACGVFTLIRTAGTNGNGGSDLKWRWSQSPEERLLSQAQEANVHKAASSANAPQQDTGTGSGQGTQGLPAKLAGENRDADWPGFRGPARDGVVHGVHLKNDWSRSPPVQLWRRPIGPGWSSFAVRGHSCYTQEQRGDDELVACYNMSTGEPVWRHRDSVRFWESNAGAGPRATPTISNDRVYAFGATGILNALDARNGALAWSRNVASDTEAKVPMWGFSSSPLVINDLVIVAAAGKLAAYDLVTGKPRWGGTAHGTSYSSPHRVTIHGVDQVLLLSEVGATSVLPTDGTTLWEHPWRGFTIVQPSVTADGDLLISSAGASGGIGTRRLAVAPGPGGWIANERWTSVGLKPYFNDLVVHKGHAFGFDNSILACIDLENGQRQWKGGHYGNGQLVLLADQDLLLVLTEQGEVALIGAIPDRFEELARFPAIKGKTWNHPVLAGDVLLVRNGEEMAAFRLALAGR